MPNPALEELVRTVAQSVADLSLLISTVPRMVDERIAAVQQGLGEAMGSLLRQMEALQTDIGSVKGEFQVRLDGACAQLSERVEQQARITADNRAAFDAQVTTVDGRLKEFDLRITNVSNAADDLNRQVTASFTELNGRTAAIVSTAKTDLEEARSAIELKLAEVRQACDTVDLHHGVKLLQTKQAEHEASILSLEKTASFASAKMDGIEKEVQENFVRVDGVATKLSDFGKTVSQSLAEIQTTATALVDAERSEREKAFDQINPQIERLAGHVEQHTLKLKDAFDFGQDVARTVAESKQAVALVIDEAISKLGVPDIQATLAEHAERLAAVDSFVAEHTVDLKQAFDFAQTLANSVADAEQATAARIDTAISKLGVPALAEQVANHTQQLAVVDEALMLHAVRWQETEEFGQRLTASLAEAKKATVELVDTTISKLGLGLEKTVEQHAQQLSTTAGLVEKLQGSVEQHSASINAVEESLADTTKLTQTAIEGWTEMHQMLQKRIADTAEAATAGFVTVGSHIQTLQQHLDGTVEMINRTVEGLDSRVKLVDEGTARSVLELGERIGAIDIPVLAPVAERVRQLEGEITDVRQALGEYASVALVNSVVDNVENATAMTRSLASAAATMRRELDERIDQMDEGLQAALTENNDRIVNAASRLEQVEQQLPELVSRVDNNLEHAVRAQNSMRDGVETRLTQALAGATEELAARIERVREAVPAPFDPAPLREELRALVPNLTLPELGFDVAIGDDQTVMFTFDCGTKQVTRTVGLGIGIQYRGVFKAGEDYTTGNLVTHKGSMWYAKAQPTGEPGKDITGWQLAVKCGRDGRDAVPVRAYPAHTSGQTYREADFLRLNNRLWQCSVESTTKVPEPGDIRSTSEWTLIGAVQ